MCKLKHNLLDLHLKKGIIMHKFYKKITTRNKKSIFLIYIINCTLFFSSISHSSPVLGDENTVKISICTTESVTIDGKNYVSEITMEYSPGTVLEIIDSSEIFHHWEDTLGFYSELNEIEYIVPNQDVILLPVYITDLGENGNFYFSYGKVYSTGITDMSMALSNGDHFIYDINGPNFMIQDLNDMTSLPSDQAFTDANIENPVIDENYIYAATSGLQDGDYRFQVYDIDALERISDIAIGSYCNSPRSLIKGDDICCVLFDGQMVVIDSSDPYSPEQKGDISFSLEANGIHENSLVCTSGHIYNNYAYFTFAIGNMLIFDISKPNNPTHISTLYTNSSLQGSCISENTLYLAARGDGILLYDLSLPYEPNYITKYSTGLIDSWDVLYNDENLFVADGRGGIHMLDVSNELAIFEIASHKGSDFGTSLFLNSDNDKLFMIDLQGDLVFYNISSDTMIFQGLKKFAVDQTRNYFSLEFFYYPNNENGIPSCPGFSGGAFEFELQYHTPDSLSNERQFNSHFVVEELVFYNDTNHDNKLNVNYTFAENNTDYILEYSFDDEFIGSTKCNTGNQDFIISPTQCLRKDNLTIIEFNFTLNNVDITRDAPMHPEIGTIGKVNETNSYQIIINSTDWDVKLKQSLEFTPYDLDPLYFGQNFSVIGGYTIISSAYFNLTSDNMGKCDVFNRPVMSFEMEDKYTISRNEISSEYQAEITTIQAWFQGQNIPNIINYPQVVLYGINFANLSEGDTIIYDPTTILSRNGIELSIIFTIGETNWLGNNFPKHIIWIIIVSTNIVIAAIVIVVVRHYKKKSNQNSKT